MGLTRKIAGQLPYVLTESTFKFEVKTTTPDETFTLPLVSDGTYNFTINHGDGDSDIITSYNASAITHTYSIAGTYNIRITGTITGWQFVGSTSAVLIYDISSWGPIKYVGLNAFYGCTNLTISATDILDLTETTDLSYLFYGCESLTTIPNISMWDTSSITHFTYMFYKTLMNDDISGWDTSSLTELKLAFYEAYNFNRDISGWDVSNCTSLYYLFSGSNFDQDISSWDVSSITNMENIFNNITISTVNYDALILSWSAQVPTVTASFDGGDSKYTSGGEVEIARDAWIAKGWTITDGGAV